MKDLVQKACKFLAYLGAALIILLAVAVGIFRLMLPRLPEYQEEIKDWATAAIGLTVEFSDMNARWRLSGPEVSFFNAELMQPGNPERILATREVSIGVGLLRLLADRELVVDRITIRDTTIDLRQNELGEWLVQDRLLDELAGSRELAGGGDGDIEIVGENIRVNYEHPASGQLVPFIVRSATVSKDDKEIGIDVRIELPQEFGRQLHVAANQLAGEKDAGIWRYYVEGQGLDISGWSRLRPDGLPEIEGGTADLSLWLNMAHGRLESATSNVVVSGLRAAGPVTTAPVSMQGSFEFSAESNGWLLAASQFRLTTVDGEWPQTAMQLRVSTDVNGEIDAVRATASYFDLDDLVYAEAWLDESQKARLVDIAPSGELHSLRADVSELTSGEPRFNVTSDLVAVGFAARKEQPGMRGFSGRLRADRDGGRLEIESTGLTLDLGDYLPEPIILDDAYGTIIWRRSDSGVTVLSDSVRIRNADFDSESNLQLIVPADGGATFLDLESNWSINDLASMGRYLPHRFVKPALHRWLSNALESGFITRGTTRFNGALDNFPFDDGDGRFRVDARLENATLKYAEAWPAARFRHLDLVIENTRLYSLENSATNLGNNVEDAQIEIADLRTPVLTINASATGTLESIRQYAIQSPIHDVLGGQLDRVAVAGDASFDLSLTVPILDRLDFDFTTRIRSSDGSIRIDGFAAPVTELNGIVTVSRDDVSSEALFGTFLGQPVDIVLHRAGPELPGYRVLLEASGQLTADVLAAEMDLPMASIGHGALDYLATVRFPNGRAVTPGPLQIQVDTDLRGFVLDLPSPLRKEADEVMPLSAVIEFRAADNIFTRGSLAGEYDWVARFLRADAGWDFDRGVLAIGGGPAIEPGTRGLHLLGHTSEVRLQDWLDLARRKGSADGLGTRIRSIDLAIDNLHVIGQHYRDHRVEVNRSGRDWVVQINGEQAQGTITIPYDFSSGRSMTLDMQRLELPGNDGTGAAPDTVQADPRGLPSITVEAKDFALGERKLGALSVDLQHTTRGLEADNLSVVDDTFSIRGSAGWVIDTSEEAGQQTFLDLRLTSSDIEQTMRRLNYEPGISGDAMQVDMDVRWSGGPRQDFMGMLNGTVAAKLGPGQLEDVEPGAGRVFGLMSIVALPRRLSLDFRDVFESGFAFDDISGAFRIVNGEAYTCNLSLTGPAADVGIIGRTGLVSRDYAQVAVVSANVGNTLPIAGFVIAGPQVAAALLIFSQVFKKPLQEVAQISYAIDGSWEDPLIDDTNAEHFARISSLAGCSEGAQ
jgi:uncharacterized protein (TIGR02099 family)